MKHRRKTYRRRSKTRRHRSRRVRPNFKGFTLAQWRKNKTRYRKIGISRASKEIARKFRKMYP